MSQTHLRLLIFLSVPQQHTVLALIDKYGIVDSTKAYVFYLILQVLSDNNMQINTNPVEIYKTWINQLEMNTGQAR